MQFLKYQYFHLIVFVLSQQRIHSHFNIQFIIQYIQGVNICSVLLFVEDLGAQEGKVSNESWLHLDVFCKKFILGRGRHGLTTIYPITATSSRLIFAWRVSTVRQPWSLNGALRPPNSPLSLLRINFKDEDLCAPRGFLLRVEQTQFALKQGASSHNLALREIQRQREETSLFKAARPRRI